MLTVSIKVNMQQALNKLKVARDQLPFATALALTKTAQDVKAAQVAGMTAAFKRVTPYTMRSLTVERATKTNHVAIVSVRGGAEGIGAIRWLRPEIYGGKRTYAIEALLRPVGLPPSGMYAVPGRAAKLTGAGKLDINWLRSLVNDLKTQGVSGNVTKAPSRQRKGQSGLQYFVLPQAHGRLLPGIYGKRGRQVFPFVIFIHQPSYGKRFDFYGIGERTAREKFPLQFEAAVKRAGLTAK